MKGPTTIQELREVVAAVYEVEASPQLAVPGLGFVNIYIPDSVTVVTGHGETQASAVKDAHARLMERLRCQLDIARECEERLRGTLRVAKEDVRDKLFKLRRAREALDDGQCHADSDGDCDWKHCPQKVQRETSCRYWKERDES